MDEDRQITRITPTQRDPHRATIRVGRKGKGKGAVMATLSLKQIDELGLHVGQTWDEALAEQVAAAAMYDQAFRKAMHRLARRAMSRRDLDRKLRELEFDEAVRQRVLDRLTELSYLDDEAYGRAMIREQLLGKPAGPFLLRQKLMQKGLDRTLIDRLVDEAVGDSDQTEQAKDLARRRLRQMRRLDAAARKRRLYGLLARRGFDSETIGNALGELREEIGDEDELPEF